MTRDGVMVVQLPAGPVHPGLVLLDVPPDVGPQVVARHGRGSTAAKVALAGGQYYKNGRRTNISNRLSITNRWREFPRYREIPGFKPCHHPK